jgi:hypothetical protein
MRGSLSRPIIPVLIEFDRGGKRVTKHFADCRDAKPFFVRLWRQGRNPKVIAS